MAAAAVMFQPPDDVGETSGALSNQEDTEFRVGPDDPPFVRCKPRAETRRAAPETVIARRLYSLNR